MSTFTLKPESLEPTRSFTTRFVSKPDGTIVFVVVWNTTTIGPPPTFKIKFTPDSHRLTAEDHAEFLVILDINEKFEFSKAANQSSRGAASVSVEVPLGGAVEESDVRISIPRSALTQQVDYADGMAFAEKLAAENGFALDDVPDNPNVNIEHQSFGECDWNAILRRKFPVKDGDDNPHGTDLDELHEAAVLRPKTPSSSLLNTPRGSTADLVTSKTVTLGDAAVSREFITNYVEIPASSVKGGEATHMARLVQSLIYVVSTPKRMVIITTIFDPKFIYEKKLFKKTVIKHFSFGFNLAIAFAGTANAPGHNAVKAGDAAFKQEDKKDEKDKDKDKDNKDGDGNKSDAGGEGDTKQNEDRSNDQEASRGAPPTGGVLSGSLGVSIVKQKTKIYIKESETLVVDNKPLMTFTETIDL